MGGYGFGPIPLGEADGSPVCQSHRMDGGDGSGPHHLRGSRFWIESLASQTLLCYDCDISQPRAATALTRRVRCVGIPATVGGRMFQFSESQ